MSQQNRTEEAGMMRDDRAFLIALLFILFGCMAACASTVTLVWEPSGGATGYRVWQALSIGPFLVASTVTSTTATAQATEASRFFVTAFNGGGESAPSNVVSYTPGQTPPPTVPVAVAVGTLAQPGNGQRNGWPNRGHPNGYASPRPPWHP